MNNLPHVLPVINAWQQDFLANQQLPVDYLQQVAPIVARICVLYQNHNSAIPWCLAISGAQGSGKSTLGAYLVEYFKLERKKNAISISLDDYYLSPNQRAEYARKNHSLFMTRGVPGTHDIRKAINDLLALKQKRHCVLPLFDKSQDRPFAKKHWQQVEQPQDIIIFEGWCVGLSAEPSERLLNPVNQFESERDVDGQFRRLINQVLGAEYQTLFSLVDNLVYLSIRDFSQVLAWRTLQEHKLIAKTGLGMSDAQLVEFVQYCERLTIWGQVSLPGTANLVIHVDKNPESEIELNVEG